MRVLMRASVGDRGAQIGAGVSARSAQVCVGVRAQSTQLCAIACARVARQSHALLVAHRYVQVVVRVACRYVLALELGAHSCVQILALEARGNMQARALLAHRYVQVVVPMVHR